jgi:hypothetical protein
MNLNFGRTPHERGIQHVSVSSLTKTEHVGERSVSQPVWRVPLVNRDGRLCETWRFGNDILFSSTKFTYKQTFLYSKHKVIITVAP